MPGKRNHVVFAVLFLLCTHNLYSGSFNIILKETGFLVMDGQDSVFFYHTKPTSLNGKYKRADYLHPVWDLAGNVMTEDFPRDHRHHRGIFWAWHQIYIGNKRVGDGWMCRDIHWCVKKVTLLQVDSLVKFRARVLWQSPNWLDEKGQEKPFVRETTTITAGPVQGNRRTIDFTIQLQALENSVRIGGSEDQKGYGGFSLRIRMPEDLRFISAGKSITPKKYQITAGPWMDFSGTFGDTGKSGITLFVHPSSPGYPQPWILRQKRSMQNAVYPGRQPVALPANAPLTFRYRIVIHQGDAEAIDMDRLYRDYSQN